MAPPPPIPAVQMPTPISSADHHQYHNIYQQQQQQQQQQHYGGVLTSNNNINNSGSRSANAQYSANFWENYEHLCALQNVMPLQSLKQTLATEGGANLTLNADKLK